MFGRSVLCLGWWVVVSSYFLRSEEHQTSFEINLKELASGKLTLKGHLCSGSTSHSTKCPLTLFRIGLLNI